MALPPSWHTPHRPRDSPFSRIPSPLPAVTTPHMPITSSNPFGISYSTQLTPRISKHLAGDKVCLPQETLEALLSSVSAARTAAAAAAIATSNSRDSGESWAGWREKAGPIEGDEEALLPHPITFRLYNSQNNRYTHAVPREFSAGEDEVVISPFLAEVLGLADSTPDPSSSSPAPLPPPSLSSSSSSPPSSSNPPNAISKVPKLTVMFTPLPKGSYVRLRPLEAGYDEQDWKSLLERELRVGYSTLTLGEVLTVSGKYRFLIDKFLPEDAEAVTVVDTDMELEMQPLSEEQARETLRRRLEKDAKKGKGLGGKTIGGRITVGETLTGTVKSGEYIDFKLGTWNRAKGVAVELVVGEGAGGDEEVGGQVDLLVSTSRYRGVGGEAVARETEFLWGELGSDSTKKIVIGKGNVELLPLSDEQMEGSGEGAEGVEYLSIAVHGYCPSDSDSNTTEETLFHLHVSQEHDDLNVPTSDTTPQIGPDAKLCTNCLQAIPLRTYSLHIAFCHRNNILCPYIPSCGAIFRRGTDIHAKHWHCTSHDCRALGNDGHGGLTKHITLFHTPRTCRPMTSTSISCDYEAPSTPSLAHHRTTTCPARFTLCRFCHLFVPQEGFSDMREQERYTQHLLTGLTSHELTCGSRTTDCDICGRPIKLVDIRAHNRHHDLERLSRPKPVICANINCSKTVSPSFSSSSSSSMNELGLCAICFGQFHAPGIYDPTGSHLRRRVERKLLTQGVTGCSRPSCANTWCKTGRSNLGLPPFEGGMARIKADVVSPLLDSWTVGGDAAARTQRQAQTLRLRLCVDAQTQKMRALAEAVCAGEGFEIEWGIRAVEETGGKGEEAVRKWLGRWGVRVGERDAEKNRKQQVQGDGEGDGDGEVR